jgi:hypothetical protein
MFSDGSGHRYENIPDNVTPDQIEARVKKDFPGKQIKNIDGGKGNSQQSINAQQSSNNNLSQFNIKGLRFGMTLDQVVSITNAKSPYNQKPATDFYAALNGFTIAGIEGGHYGWSAEDNNGKLVRIHLFPRSEEIDSLLTIFSTQYGKPQLRQFKSRTKGGLDLNDYTATWNVQDAIIEMNRHINRDDGYVSISSRSFKDQEAAKYKAQDEKARRDF